MLGSGYGLETRVKALFSAGLSKMKVVFVCLGNICRSPLAEGIFLAHVQGLGRSDAFVVDSAGTSGWHDGKPPHEASVRIAKEHGVDIRAQRSRKFLREDFDRFDVIVAMDASNRENILALDPAQESRVVLLRDFDPDKSGADVPDPWEKGDWAYQEVYEMITRCMPGLTAWIDKRADA